MENMIHSRPHLRLVESARAEKTMIADTSPHLADQQMHIMGRLQTTLDVEKLIAIFAYELEHVLSFSGMDYINDDRKIHLRSGENATHKANYDLKIEGEELGSFVFYRRNRFQESDLNKLEVLLSTLVYPIKNALAFRMAQESALSDPLTGAHNRLAMDIALKREIELAKRQGSDMSIILLDADHFKATNDAHGHAHGDEVLKTIASIARQTIRQSDMLFRFGGEEFLILLSQTGVQGAALLAERIREHIQEIDKIKGIDASSVTVSLGVTELKTSDDSKMIFDRADKALYQAKDKGRNCSVVL